MYDTNVRINMDGRSEGMKIEMGRQSQAKTRRHILDVAERLFADQGLDAVSIRDITTKAKTSLGAINYHFGTKQGLIAAIFDRRLTPLSEARLAALEAVERKAGSKNPRIEDVLDAFIRPAFSKEGGDRHHTFRKLMGRCLSEPSPDIEKMLHAHFQTVIKRFDAALLRALPGLNKPELFWRMSYVIAGLHHVLLMVGGAFPLPPDIDLDEEAVVKRQIQFAAAVLRTPAFR